MSGGLSLPSLYNDKGDERVPYWERSCDCFQRSCPICGQDFTSEEEDEDEV